MLSGPPAVSEVGVRRRVVGGAVALPGCAVHQSWSDLVAVFGLSGDGPVRLDECGVLIEQGSVAAEPDRHQAPITLHRHQRDAVEVARTGTSYVLTTGTGSGKSLAYIAPIVDRVLREGSGDGIKAVVVYPDERAG